jgi:hypothetical protein
MPSVSNRSDYDIALLHRRSLGNLVIRRSLTGFCPPVPVGFGLPNGRTQPLLAGLLKCTRVLEEQNHICSIRSAT